MRLIMTMAGKYQRFKLFGNKVPKYLMPLGKNSVLWHVIEEFISNHSKIEIFLVANSRDRDFEPVLLSIMDHFSIPSNNLAYIEDTNSQLETAIKIENLYNNIFENNNEPLAFTNIDTVLKNRRNFFDKLSKIDPESGLIDAFLGNSHEYSYVMEESEDDLLAKDIVDKNRISSFACSGLYGFGSASFFFNESRNVLSSESGNFTSLYKSFLLSKKNVFINKNNDLRDTIVLGTPEEYITNLHRFS
ncbi:hypothetical protein N9Z21_05480 [Gammaproteobacteria bacterium]|nr:hypothetical protein [Gammaproteobacteria bacterium]